MLSAIARAPRSSNREIAAAAGMVDEGQTSHLLRRLAQRGLIEKVTPRSGSRRENAWLLTPAGRRVIELLGLASPAACARVRGRDDSGRQRDALQADVICDGRAKRRARADERSVPRGAGASAAYKRPSALVPLVPVLDDERVSVRGPLVPAGRAD